MDSSRISGKIEKISDDEVKSFFDSRAEKKNDDTSRYSPTFFLFDTDPELAKKRDMFEKEQFLQRIKRSGYKEGPIKILDIGCGVGRWADLYRDKDIGEYIGIDFSEKMIEIAKEEYKEDGRFRFLVGRYQDLSQVLKENDCDKKYDLVIITGVFMYINDQDVPLCISQTVPYVKDNGIIYINNPICHELRLTLKDYHSKELNSQYSAIYRTIEEWERINGDCYPANFKVTESDYTYPQDMRNRSDTADYYWVIKRS